MASVRRLQRVATSLLATLYSSLLLPPVQELLAAHPVPGWSLVFLPAALQRVAPRIALLDLTADRVSQGLLGQLPVDPLVGTPRPERTAEAEAGCNRSSGRSAADRTPPPRPSSPESRGRLGLDPGLPVGRPAPGPQAPRWRGEPCAPCGTSSARTEPPRWPTPDRPPTTSLHEPRRSAAPSAPENGAPAAYRPMRRRPVPSPTLRESRRPAGSDGASAASGRPAAPPRECSSGRPPDSRPPRSRP